MEHEGSFLILQGRAVNL